MLRRTYKRTERSDRKWLTELPSAIGFINHTWSLMYRSQSHVQYFSWTLNVDTSIKTEYLWYKSREFPRMIFCLPPDNSHMKDIYEKNLQIGYMETETYLSGVLSLMLINSQLFQRRKKQKDLRSNRSSPIALESCINTASRNKP